MRVSARRLLALCTAAAALCALAAPANAAQVVNGTVQPSKLRGQPTIAMFFHPF